MCLWPYRAQAANKLCFLTIDLGNECWLLFD
jgi:hypothetical protein